MKKPNSMRHLDDAIRRLSGNTPQGFMQARTVMANAIVASMLPRWGRQGRQCAQDAFWRR